MQRSPQHVTLGVLSLRKQQAASVSPRYRPRPQHPSRNVLGLCLARSAPSFLTHALDCLGTHLNFGSSRGSAVWLFQPMPVPLPVSRLNTVWRRLGILTSLH